MASSTHGRGGESQDRHVREEVTLKRDEDDRRRERQRGDGERNRASRGPPHDPVTGGRNRDRHAR